MILLLKTSDGGRYLYTPHDRFEGRPTLHDAAADLFRSNFVRATNLTDINTPHCVNIAHVICVSEHIE